MFIFLGPWSRRKNFHLRKYWTLSCISLITFLQRVTFCLPFPDTVDLQLLLFKLFFSSLLWQWWMELSDSFMNSQQIKGMSNIHRPATVGGTQGKIRPKSTCRPSYAIHYKKIFYILIRKTAEIKSPSYAWQYEPTTSEGHYIYRCILCIFWREHSLAMTCTSVAVSVSNTYRNSAEERPAVHPVCA